MIRPSLKLFSMSSQILIRSAFEEGEQDVPFDVLRLLEQHLDLVAVLDGDVAFDVLELVERNQTFGLVADVDDHRRLAHAHHLAADDLALGQIA